ncbi:unnamed protein product [Taenia asiatica]|uniref:NR LBD domain-containing protein n=1 Tax=Taenia asiatica TaxID=60517 RepID=A0A0R3VZP2_TAEAS|nr:unnamed protein product [Taenia asiatica]
MLTDGSRMQCFEDLEKNIFPSIMQKDGMRLAQSCVFASLQGAESADDLSEQTRWFVQARTNLQVLLDSFAHAPSRDMSPELLRFLVRIMQVSYHCCSFPPSFQLSPILHSSFLTST